MSEHANDTNRIVESVLPGDSATVRVAHASLKGERRGLHKLWPFLGPAFVAAVAYVDPGNFALIPLLIHCRNRGVMGTLVNDRLTTAIATVVVTLIVSLNVFLLYQTFFA